MLFIGLQMPEQEDPTLSTELILQNNTLQDNQTNYVFDQKKEEYDLLYTEGDDPVTIGTYNIVSGMPVIRTLLTDNHSEKRGCGTRKKSLHFFSNAIELYRTKLVRR
jgi:hypothetical protein